MKDLFSYKILATCVAAFISQKEWEGNGHSMWCPEWKNYMQHYDRMLNMPYPSHDEWDNRPNRIYFMGAEIWVSYTIREDGKKNLTFKVKKNGEPVTFDRGKDFFWYYPEYLGQITVIFID